jgi:hypothetical protein
MNKLFFSFTIFLSFWCTSCDVHCNWLLEELDKEECHNEDGCIIDLKDIFKEEWSSLYFFIERHSSREISNSLGFEYLGHGTEDGGIMIMSTAEKKVLREYRMYCFDLNLLIIDYDAGFIRIDSDSSKLSS